ncbi:MAG: helix-hairpin-helix domain-containing protein [Planctomycetia bacterium]|nr:MAG: helix-hairpin-helix domain-containing protein [Planctomycetia bacterium]
MTRRAAVASVPTAAVRAGAAAALLTLCALAAQLGSAAFRSAPPTPPRGAAALRIDPNTASAAELQLLPGIGPARASAILSYRESVAAPAFVSSADLDAVRGIGPGTLREISDFVAVPEAKSEPFP